MAGAFIVLEGTEGAGKTTQTRLLADRLTRRGYKVLTTREPGGTAIGERIRSVLLGPDDCAMLPATEALLLAAARAQLVGEVIRPALAAGMTAICDRYIDSTYAYQGGGRGLAMRELKAVQQLATGGLLPDLRVFLDLPVEIGLDRRFAAPEAANRLDRAELAFHVSVRHMYDALIAADPQDWLVIDAAGDEATVAERLGWQVEQWLAQHAPLPGGEGGGTGSRAQ